MLLEVVRERSPFGRAFMNRPPAAKKLRAGEGAEQPWRKLR